MAAYPICGLWSAQVPAFAPRFRTIAYSRRYARPNTPIAPDAPDPVETHVADLAGVIDAEVGRSAHVVGHSWGGLIALMLALSDPAACRSLVLIEPPVVSMHVPVPPGPLDLLRLVIASPALALAVARLGGGALGPAERAFRRGDDETAVAHLGNGILGRQAFAALSPERRQQVWENRAPDRAMALHHGFPDLRGADFTSVTCPVLLVDGDGSPRVFPLLNAALAARLPRAQRQTVAGASHLVHEDAPAAFNAVVLDFLGGIG